ncbi:PLAT/LH2 domain-containing protein [Paenibacillus sp. S-38]|uniref:PLAT/LH2 domain-containing protein n=1 Tax=Paenibacillus sp. S-38 TaxID=3416710 RepID=UPI003CE76D14
MKKRLLRVLSTVLAVPMIVGALAAPASAATKGYTVYVQTANVDNAGTDSNIKIKILGANGSLGPTPLDNPGVNDFEQGAYEKFPTISSPDLGNLSSLILYSDGSGSKSGYLVDYVKVYADGVHVGTFRPKANEWLGEVALTSDSITLVKL